MSPLSRLVIAGKESRRLRICQYKLPILEKKKKDWKDQFSSVAQLCPTLCDPMNRSMPGLPVHHHLPEFTQTHVHQVSDAIQPSHPQSSPSPPLAAKNIISLILVLTIWWCPCVESSLCCWKRVFAMTSAFSWQNSIRLCPASFCIPRPNLPVTPGYLYTG